MTSTRGDPTSKPAKGRSARSGTAPKKSPSIYVSYNHLDNGSVEAVVREWDENRRLKNEWHISSENWEKNIISDASRRHTHWGQYTRALSTSNSGDVTFLAFGEATTGEVTTSSKETSDKSYTHFGPFELGLVFTRRVQSNEKIEFVVSEEENQFRELLAKIDFSLSEEEARIDQLIQSIEK